MKCLHRARLAGALILLAAAASPALGAAAAQTAQAGQKRVESFLQGLDGLQAQFKQVLTDRSGPPVDEASGTLALSSAMTVRTSPSAPSSSSWRMASNFGRNFDHIASPAKRLALAAAAAMSRAPPASIASGFSTSTCLPPFSASSALLRWLGCVVAM